MKRLPFPSHLLLSLTFLGVLAVFLASSTRAQESQSASEATAEVQNLSEITQGDVELMAIPPRLGDDGSLRGDPGETIQTQVRVRNVSNQTLNVRTISEDFIIGEDGRTPLPVDVEANSLWSLASWIQIPNPENTLAPQASATIPITITIPANALPGGRFAMVMHEPVEGDLQVPQTGAVSGAAGIRQRVGTLVYFRVNGEVKENAAIRNIDIPFLREYGPVPIKFAIENLSDIHIRPHTKVVLTNMLGQTSGTIEAPQQNIFPYTLRDYNLNWDKVWGFGRYTAHIEVTYGEQGKAIQAKQHFWIIPYTLILAILVAILALIAIIIAVRRHLHHRNSVEQQHISLLEDRVRQLEEELQNRK